MADAKTDPLKKAIAGYKFVKYGSDKKLTRDQYARQWKVKTFPAFILETKEGSGHKIIRNYTTKEAFIEALK